MEEPESLWLALALGQHRRFDFSSEAGLLEMQLSAFLPGSRAEEAAERFAAERDVGVGLELARLLTVECGHCEGARRAKLADLAAFAELLCACLGDGGAAAKVARNLLWRMHSKNLDGRVARTTLSTAAIGWLDASVRISEIVASHNPPREAVAMGTEIIGRHERAAVRRARASEGWPSSAKRREGAEDETPPDEEAVQAGDAPAAPEVAARAEAPRGLVVVAGVAAGRSGVGSDFVAIDGRPLDLLPVPDLAPLRTDLVAEFPYVAEVIDAVLGDLASRRSIWMKPVLLVGPPGCGKTRLARRLFELLGLPAATYPCGGISDSAFAGTARRWSSSEPSLPLRLIQDRACANPGILLDEIDKPAAGKGGSGGRLWDALVAMLEPETARAWRDPYVDAEVKVPLTCGWWR